MHPARAHTHSPADEPVAEDADYRERDSADGGSLGACRILNHCFTETPGGRAEQLRPGFG